MPQVYVSLGSNIDPETNICSCTQYLRARFKQIISSGVYQTPAAGFKGAPFLNSVVGFETDMGIKTLRNYLHKLEEIHDRTRGIGKFGPRTLDVDLLLYGNRVMPPDNNLPHSDILKYPFVLYPLAEIAPEKTHPVLNKSFHQIARHSNLSSHDMTPVQLDCENSHALVNKATKPSL